MLEHTRHTSALTVAQKHNETFLRNSTETKKLREHTTHLCNKLKRVVKAEKSIARRNLFSDAKSNSVGNEFQAFVGLTRSLKKCDLVLVAARSL